MCFKVNILQLAGIVCMLSFAVQMASISDECAKEGFCFSRWLPWDCRCCGGPEKPGYIQLAKRAKSVCCNPQQDVPQCLKSCNLTLEDCNEQTDCRKVCQVMPVLPTGCPQPVRIQTATPISTLTTHTITRKPTTSTTTRKPTTRPTTRKPTTSTTTRKPTTRTTTRKPKTTTTARKLTTRSTTRKPTTNTTTIKPTTRTTTRKSKTTATARKLTTNTTIRKTFTSNTILKPSGSTLTKTPATSTTTTTPKTNTKARNSSTISQTRKPTTSSTTRKASINTTDRKPMKSTTAKIPTASTSRKSATSTTTQKPTTNTTTRKFAISTKTIKPTTSHTTKKPMTITSPIMPSMRVTNDNPTATAIRSTPNAHTHKLMTQPNTQFYTRRSTLASRQLEINLNKQMSSTTITDKLTTFLSHRMQATESYGDPIGLKPTFATHSIFVTKPSASLIPTSSRNPNTKSNYMLTKSENKIATNPSMSEAKGAGTLLTGGRSDFPESDNGICRVGTWTFAGDPNVSGSICDIIIVTLAILGFGMTTSCCMIIWFLVLKRNLKKRKAKVEPKHVLTPANGSFAARKAGLMNINSF